MISTLKAYGQPDLLLATCTVATLVQATLSSLNY